LSEGDTLSQNQNWNHVATCPSAEYVERKRIAAAAAAAAAAAPAVEAAGVVLAAASFDKNGHDLADSRTGCRCCRSIVAYSGELLTFGHEIDRHSLASVVCCVARWQILFLRRNLQQRTASLGKKRRGFKQLQLQRSGQITFCMVGEWEQPMREAWAGEIYLWSVEEEGTFCKTGFRLYLAAQRHGWQQNFSDQNSR
jgi:hypothetical protein